MKSLILFSVACLQFCWTHGEGVGAYAYQDSAGNRYGGTYGLKDNELLNFKGLEDATFGPVPTPFVDFQDLDSFIPEYFRNLENTIQEAFAKSFENQKKALDAARKAFDVTSNQVGYIPTFDFNRFPSFPSFGFPGSNFGTNGFSGMARPSNPFMQNSVFSGAAIGPGYQHETINLSPANPKTPNIDVTKFSDGNRQGNSGPGYYSVQSTSYVQSSNINGVQSSKKGGETIVNDNGKITKYSLND